MSKNTIQELHASYADYLTGHYLIGSATVGIPFYKKEIEVKGISEKQLNTVEEFIGRCVKKGYQDREEIADILSIDLNLLDYMISPLLATDFFIVNSDTPSKIFFTEKGKELFDQKIKESDYVDYVSIYFDGLTEVNSVRYTEKESDNFYHYQDKKDEITIQARNFPELNAANNKKSLTELLLQTVNEKAYIEAQQEENPDLNKIKQITSYKFSLPERELKYRNYHLLFYLKSDSIEPAIKNVDFLVIDEVSEKIEPTFQEAIREQLLDGKFDKYFDLETILVEEQSAVLEANVLALTNSFEEVPIPRYLMNDKIHKLFMHFLDHAEESLYIISPWMNNYVFHNYFHKKLLRLLDRGVKVKIIYGITDRDDGQSNSRNKLTFKIADQLKEIAKDYDGLLALKNGETHEKMLICDRYHYVNGSYNFLSYSADPEKNNISYRNEGCTYFKHEELSDSVIKERFDF